MQETMLETALGVLITGRRCGVVMRTDSRSARGQCRAAGEVVIAQNDSGLVAAVAGFGGERIHRLHHHHRPDPYGDGDEGDGGDDFPEVACRALDLSRAAVVQSLGEKILGEMYPAKDHDLRL